MKRTRGKKSTNKNKKRDEEPSASTSSTSMEKSRGGSRTTDQNIQGEKASKKINKAGSSNPSGQVQMEAGAAKSQGSKDEEASMNNLPPEMLTRILKYVDNQSLLKCRLVNRNWSAISSGILFNRPRMDFIPFFKCRSNPKFLWGNHDNYPTGQKSLEDFLHCMKKSKSCPYSSFAFCIRESSTELFNEEAFKEFLLDFAPSNSSQSPRIKGLQFATHFVRSMTTFQIFIEQVGDLLQNKTPLLERLVLNFEYSVEAPQVSLFSVPKEADEANVAAVVPFQLPHLKSVQFGKGMISAYTQIVKDLLNAAVNLKWLRVWSTKFQDFQLLHSLGKLHLFKEVEIEIDQEFFSALNNDKSYSSFPLPQLEFLNVMMSMTETNDNFIAQTTNFLGNLFESSKDSMEVLAVEPIGRLSSLQLPTFKNLWKLQISQYHNQTKQQIFPPGIRSRDVFSAVCYLELYLNDWTGGFPQEDSIPLLSNVKTLILRNDKIEPRNISMLTLMCPNLRKLVLHKSDNTSPQLNFFLIAQSIWTQMKQLESLEMDLDVDARQNNSAALDSAFTGISIGDCQRLYEVVEAKKTLEKWGGRGWFPESALKAEREFPSILDMKDLQKLTIHPYSAKKLETGMEFFTKKLTWVSEEYAFKLMPELKLNED